MKRGLLFLLLTGCDAILGLPEPNVDPNFGRDGSVSADGAPADASSDASMGDASSDVVTLPDGGCDCFGGPCMNNVCMAFVHTTNLTDPRAIDSDGARLFVASGATTLLSIDVATKAQTTLTSSEVFMSDVRAFGGNVYFASGSSASRCGPTSCQGRVDYYKSNNARAWGVATSDGSNVYVSYDDMAGGGGVYLCAGGSCGNNLVHVVDTIATHQIMVDSMSLYWIRWNGAGVFGCLKGSCGSGSGMMSSSVVDFTIDASNIYYAQSSGIFKQSRQGNSLQQIVGGQANIVAVRADGSYVFWLTKTNLYRCPMGADCVAQSSKIQTLASGLNGGYGLTLTSDSAFFTEEQGGQIWRVKK